jgi:hypothetical protein
MTELEYNKNSLCYWYEITKGLDIPQPYTVIYKIPEDHLKQLRIEQFPKQIIDDSKKIINQDPNLIYPIFLRTDQASGKHGWKRSCFVEKEETLKSNIYEVIIANLLADILGLPFTALVFREYIPLESKFTAFWGELPIAKERRIFIKNGKIQCSHPYWPEDAIEQPSIIYWREELKELNTLTKKDESILKKYSEILAKNFEDYWSVDFAKGRDGKWYLIDMAKGENSFHYLECEFCPEEMKKRYQRRERE